MCVCEDKISVKLISLSLSFSLSHSLSPLPLFLSLSLLPSLYFLNLKQQAMCYCNTALMHLNYIDIIPIYDSEKSVTISWAEVVG